MYDIFGPDTASWKRGWAKMSLYYKKRKSSRLPHDAANKLVKSEFVYAINQDLAY